VSAPGLTQHDITDVEDATYVLRHAVQFAPIMHEATAELNAGTVVHINGDEHFERRRILSQLFRRSAMEEHERTVLIPELDAALERLRADGTTRFDLLLFLRTAYAAILARVVGLHGLETEAGRLEFEHDFAIFERGGRSKYAVRPEELVPPAIAAQERLLTRNFEPAWAERLAHFDRHRRDPVGTPPLPNDLITLMIVHGDHYAQWDDKAIRNEACLLMVASVGSTANALCHAVYDLITWSEADPARRAALTDPEFLSRSFRESVRLHQTNVMQRLATEDVVLPSGLSVRRDEIVAVNRHAVNHYIERTSGTDTRFDPDRAAVGELQTYGLAFGDGPHNCIGRNMVLGDVGHEQEAGRREGFAVATLSRLFAAHLALDPADPPRQVEDFAREFWLSFPVTVGWSSP